jgi:hypothetical protein
MLNAKTKQDNLEILATKIDEVRAENAEMLKKIERNNNFLSCISYNLRDVIKRTNPREVLRPQQNNFAEQVLLLALGAIADKIKVENVRRN